MTPQIAWVLLIVVGAVVAFSLEWVSVDVIALSVLLSLVLLGLVPGEEAFAGFGSDIVIVILGLFILTAALQRTGVIDLTGRIFLRFTGDNPIRLFLVITGAALGLGAFISNTAATAFFLPIVLGLANRARVSASKLLMPLAFASILASSLTLVSTSTNIVVSGMMTQNGLAPMSMFELTPVGIPIALVGVTYMFFIGRRLIPERTLTGDTGNGPGSRLYLTEAVILPESPLDGKTLAESGLGRDLDLTVLRLERGKDRSFVPRGNSRLVAGDVLLMEGHRDEILKIKDAIGLDIKADVMLSDPDLEAEDTRLAEAILLPRSPLIRRTLKNFHFRERFGLQVLAVYRHGRTIRKKISQIRFHVGDVLLIQGHPASIAAIAEDNVLNLIDIVTEKRPNLGRARVAIGTFIGVLALVTFNVVSLPVAVLLGALVVFLTRCLTPDEAYNNVEWRALILIGCMLALGKAMEYTGTAQFLSAQLISLIGNANPIWLLTAFFILSVLLTQPMSNQAAAVVVVPIAIQTALQLHLNPRTFAMMIAVAASTSYLTPLEPACLMVYGAGGYRFTDFLKVGSLLTLLIYIIAILLVPIIWPL